MKTKFLLFITVFLFLFSTQSFANTNSPYWIDGLRTSNNTQVRVYSDYPIQFQSPYIYTKGLWYIYNGTTLVSTLDHGSNYITATAITISNSNHDIFNRDGTTLFFRALTMWEKGLQSQSLLQNLVIILPIILGGILLVIGFRKAWAMLIRTFKVI